MCGTASSQKRHTYLLQFVMLSIYHLFNRISIHLHHLQRYFIKIRAAVHHFVQQPLCMMSYCTNRRPDRCFMPENTWFRKLRPKSHPDILFGRSAGVAFNRLWEGGVWHLLQTKRRSVQLRPVSLVGNDHILYLHGFTEKRLPILAENRKTEFKRCSRGFIRWNR